MGAPWGVPRVHPDTMPGASECTNGAVTSIWAMARRPKIYEIISIFRDEDDGDDIFRSRISAFFKFEILSLF